MNFTIDGRCVDAQVSARNLDVVAGEILRNFPSAGPVEHPDLRGLQLAGRFSAENLPFIP